MKKYKNEVEENERVRISRNEAERASGTRTAVARRGAPVSEIEEGSIAEELGIQAGAQLLEINDQPARDSIQLKMAELSSHITLTVLQPDGQPEHFDIEKDAYESVGLGLDAELFDGVKRCTNKCPFCFVDQLPPRVKNTFGSQQGFKNLRRTLYVRDDDYRLSFLHGHYITLTNLKDEDYQRIINEKLSPLCVSVHATDPATRIKMLGNKTGGDIMERLRFLIDNGIQINAQIVLCPGINDGAILEKSVWDLFSLWPGIESMAVVPAGLTKFLPPDRGLRPVKPEEAEAAIALIKPLQREAMKRSGVRFVYPSDEMYLLAGQPMPSAKSYDGYPQYANGVGVIRSFLDEVAQLRRRATRPKRDGKLPSITLVTGELAADALRELAKALEEKNIARAQVAEIKNTFWGGNVACAGLLMGQEILDNLQSRPCGDYVFLPPDAVDNRNRMLDDITLEEMSARLGTTVRCDANGPLQLATLLSREDAASVPHQFSVGALRRKNIPQGVGADS